MNNKKLLIALLLLGSTVPMLGQVHNKGILYVGDNGKLYTNGKYNFGAGAAALKTKTTRVETTNGLVSLSSAAITASTNDGTNFVDGFVKITPTATAAFYKSPIGFNNNYGPIGFNTTNASPIVNAYYRANPTTVGSAIDTDELVSISANEHWRVASANTAKITVYWNSFSDVTTILGSKALDYLTVVAYDTNSSKWVALNTTINNLSSKTSGSMTTGANVSLVGFSNFTIGSRKDLACYPPVEPSEAIAGGTKTYENGVWTPGEPTINDKVIINSPLTILSGAPISCYAVVQNADITMGNGAKLTVVNGFTTATGKKIIMTNLASVLQQNSNAEAPMIEMTRIATAMRRYDYVFISNPLNSVADFFSQILNKNNAAVNGQFTGSLSQPKSAFQQLRTFNADGLVAVDANITNTPIGRGLSSTVRNQAPYGSSNVIVDGQPVPWDAQKLDIHIKLTGKTNNGSYELALPAVAGGYTRLGNPYPSPIDLRQIFKANEGKFEETAYYWTYHTARSNITTNAATYTSADFSTFNLNGGVSAYPAGPGQPNPEPVPDGLILPLQSVLVQTKAAGPAIIDNCVRNSSYVAPTPPTSGNDLNGRFRLNLVGSDKTYNQLLLVYDGANGTTAVDNGYDSSRLLGLGSEISTLIDDTRYVIETRPSFTVEDVVPIKLDKRTDETFTISMVDAQGVFNTTSVLLHDKTLGIYHDLSANNYAFAQTDPTDTLRFEIVYQNTVLNNGDFNAKNAFAFITKNQFRAQSNSSIAEIAIYDIAGRLIITYTGINQQGFSSSFDRAQGVYIAKIKLVDGTIVNQKVINQ